MQVAQPSVLRSAKAEERQTNLTQPGSAPGSGGTTSTVSKPATPLSLATEYGGITSSTKGQTVTLQMSLDSIPRALAANGDIPYCSNPLVVISGQGCISKSTIDYLARVGVGVSENTSPGTKNVTGSAVGVSQGSAQEVTLSSVGNQAPSLASAFIKYQFIKASVSQGGLPTIDTNVKNKADQVADARDKLLTDMPPAYKTWHDCFIRKMRESSVEKRGETFQKCYPQIADILAGNQVTLCDNTTVPRASPQVSATALADLVTYIAASESLQAAYDAAVAAKAGDSPLTGEIDYNTPQDQPVNWTAKLVGSFTFAKSKQADKASGATLTYNAGASIYGSTPSSAIPGASRLRDVQAGTEFDLNIASSQWPGLLGKIGDTTASIAIYYQYQSSPAILNVTPGSPVSGVTITGLPSTATQVFAQKGNIFVAQARWGFGTGTSAKFPISVTYANRTELIVHPNWGAQVGVSYDFTSLLGSNGSGQ